MNLHTQTRWLFYTVFILFIIYCNGCSTTKTTKKGTTVYPDVYACINGSYAPSLGVKRPVVKCMYNIKFGYADCRCDQFDFIRTTTGNVIPR